MRKDISPSLEKWGKTTAKLGTKITMKSPPTTTAKFEDQNFKSCQIVRKDILPSLEKGGKRIRKLERKTITMRSPARTTATFGGLKIQNLPIDQ